MLQVLGHLTDNLEYYIPSRFDEGYGLNKAAVQKIKDRGADVIITVDCGSVAADEVRFAKEIGLEIMVTDHHNITDKIADCVLINPKQPGCGYPYKLLAGCGVAFKLAQALQQKADLPKSVLTDVLDLVAIGTIGDIVPLLDENRTLVKYGMKVLNLGRRKGLKRLADEISLKVGDIRSDQVAFAIAPHLNACGRMATAGIGVELMTAADDAAINLCVDRIIDNNRARKKAQDETYAKCLEIAEKECADDLFIAINCEGAHEGIMGIVAGKIKDRFYRPTVIVTRANSAFGD
jgi:single-stranded-DNA-specific exonuclease